MTMKMWQMSGLEAIAKQKGKNHNIIIEFRELAISIVTMVEKWRIERDTRYSTLSIDFISISLLNSFCFALLWMRMLICKCVWKYEIWSSQFWNVDVKFKIKIISLVPKVALIIVFFYFYSLRFFLSCSLTLSSLIILIDRMSLWIWVNLTASGVVFCFVSLFFLCFIFSLENSFDTRVFV